MLIDQSRLIRSLKAAERYRKSLKKHKEKVRATTAKRGRHLHRERELADITRERHSDLERQSFRKPPVAKFLLQVAGR